MASTIRNTTVTWGMLEFPVALRKASEKEDVKFETAIEVTDEQGKVTGYERVVTHRAGHTTGVRGVSGANVGETENIVRGVWAGDEFRPIDKAELDKVMEGAQIDAIDLEDFVLLKDVPFYRAEAAYFLAPQKGLIGAKPMRLLRDALKAEKSAAVCKLCLKGTGGRQKLAVISEAEGKLLVNILSFAGDFRDTDESAGALDKVEAPKAHLTVARELIRAKLAEPATLLAEAVDDAVAERERLYAEALAGGEVKAKVKGRQKKAQPVGDDDLMARLEQSVAQATRELAGVE